MAFLRGLADTDFSVSFKKGGRKSNSYPRIVAVSASERLIKDVESILPSLGISYCKQVVLNKNSFGTFVHYRLDINGKTNFSRWMDTVGFSNPKHLSKIAIWRKFGNCPPNTTYAGRLEIIKGNG